MGEPKLTVIVPAYNCEPWIDRALDSIPLAKDTQVIVINDGSTDDTWSKILTWYDNNYNKLHRDTEIINWVDNHGIAAGMNIGFERATGEYIVSLSADDYYLTDFGQFRRYLDGKNDLVYFDLEVNDGTVWHINEQSKQEFVGAVKFIRRAFLGDTRVPDKKWHEDKPFSLELYAKNPREVFTGVALKHYNWPREGSLSWQANHEDK